MERKCSRGVAVYGILVILAGVYLLLTGISSHLFLNVICILFSFAVIFTGISIIKLRNWARLLVLVLLTLWLAVVLFSSSLYGEGFDFGFFLSNSGYVLAHFIPVVISYYFLNHPKVKEQFK